MKNILTKLLLEYKELHNDDKFNWIDHISRVQYIMNHSKSKALYDNTPYEILTSRKSNYPRTVLNDKEKYVKNPLDVDLNYVINRMKVLDAYHNWFLTFRDQLKFYNNARYNDESKATVNNLQPGTIVYAKVDDPKFGEAPYIGPLTVLERVNAGYRLIDPDGLILKRIYTREFLKEINTND
eukprot:UN02731